MNAEQKSESHWKTYVCVYVIFSIFYKYIGEKNTSFEISYHKHKHKCCMIFCVGPKWKEIKLNEVIMDFPIVSTVDMPFCLVVVVFTLRNRKSRRREWETCGMSLSVFGITWSSRLPTLLQPTIVPAYTGIRSKLIPDKNELVTVIKKSVSSTEVL